MMEYFAVAGGSPLAGRVAVHGAKNSALPILAATLLADGESVLHNCPALTDCDAALEILSCLGCRVRREGDTVTVNTACRRGHAVPDHLMGRMRASVLFLGALLAREGAAEACWPGGCALGARPIDLHIQAFQALGAQGRSWNGQLFFHAPGGLSGCRIALPIPSVGATENAMLAACGARGMTILDNPAREPEIVDLQNFLRCLGARVSGAGTGRIVVEGGRPHSEIARTVMADRIVAATYLCAVACAGGEGELLGTDGACLGPVLAALTAAGCTLDRGPGRLAIRRGGELRGFGALRTGPYPGFPTDAQPCWGRWPPVPGGRAGSQRPFSTAASGTPRAWPPWGRPSRWRGTPPVFPAGPSTGPGWRRRTCGAARPSPWRPWGPRGRASSAACPTSTGGTRGWRRPWPPWAGTSAG